MQGDTDAPRSARTVKLPGGKWAIAVHEGSYATLSETYLRLVGGWFVQTGHQLADRPCIERNLNSPGDPAVRTDADLRTEVWAPIALS